MNNDTILSILFVILLHIGMILVDVGHGDGKDCSKSIYWYSCFLRQRYAKCIPSVPAFHKIYTVPQEGFPFASSFTLSNLS